MHYIFCLSFVNASHILKYILLEYPKLFFQMIKKNLQILLKFYYITISF